MNIDILNAYCGPVLVAGPPLCQGRSYHPSRLDFVLVLHCLGFFRSVGVLTARLPVKRGGRSKCSPKLASRRLLTLGADCSFFFFFKEKVLQYSSGSVSKPRRDWPLGCLLPVRQLAFACLLLTWREEKKKKTFFFHTSLLQAKY